MKSFKDFLGQDKAPDGKKSIDVSSDKSSVQTKKSVQRSSSDDAESSKKEEDGGSINNQLENMKKVLTMHGKEIALVISKAAERLADETNDVDEVTEDFMSVFLAAVKPEHDTSEEKEEDDYDDYDEDDEDDIPPQMSTKDMKKQPINKNNTRNVDVEDTK